jgi:ABC-type Mn2+/Zn2+ transport system permease subunit
VAFSVVALLQLVGVVLAIALLVIPPLVALRRWRGLPAIVIGATATAAIMSLAGLQVGARSSWPAGPAIVLIGAGLLGIAHLLPSPAARRD